MPMFRLAYGGTYTVSGVPVVTNDLASEITGSIGGLLVAAVLVMAATLLIVFRSRLRLLPLAVALAAVGITFGVTSLLGATLTMASIAVLPILIGLAVDYAIQFQSRVQEYRSEGSATRSGVVDAVARAAGEGAPTIATAALATATGFLVLLLSPVPMVRGFGVLLVVGIAIALAVRADRRLGGARGRRQKRRLRRRLDARRGGDPARRRREAGIAAAAPAGNVAAARIARRARAAPPPGGSWRARSGAPIGSLSRGSCSPPSAGSPTRRRRSRPT